MNFMRNSFSSFSARAICFTLCALAPAAHASSVTTYADLATFTSATGATSVGALPFTSNVGTSEVLGDLTFSANNNMIFGTSSAGGFSTLISGNDLAISGSESFNVDFGTAVGSFGFFVHEPSITGQKQDGTNTSFFMESVFSLKLFSGNSEIGATSFAPENDTAVFFGLQADQTFDRIEIVETTGASENEFFGGFMSGVTTLPRPLSRSVLSASATTPVPLPAGLPLLILGLGALALTRKSRSRR